MQDNLISMKDAKQLGLKHYFTGKQCPNGHVSNRYVSNRACLECVENSNLSNLEAVKERGRNWRLKNKEKEKQQRRNRYEINKDRLLSLSEAYRKANMKKYAFYAGSRRSSKLNATPCWADINEIMAFYIEAEQVSKSTGQPHEVDHIVPLQGKTVCGLHVACNLQVLPLEMNRSKSNRYWPDMWEI